MSIKIDEYGIRCLIQTGKKQGYLYMEDLLEDLRYLNLDDEQMDTIVNIFVDLGISIHKKNEEDFIDFESEIADKDIMLYDKKSQSKARSISSECFAGNNMKIFLNEIAQIPLLSAYEEQELAKQAAKGDEYAKQHLIVSNMRLVVDVAKKYQNRGVPLPDLISSGYFGLKRAIEKFEVEKGHKLSTYATWWIRQSVHRAIGDTGRNIRVPIHILEILFKYKKATLELFQQLGREPKESELAEYLNLPVEKIREIQRHAQDTISINKPLGNDDNEAEEMLGISSNDTPNSVMDEMDRKSAIDEILSSLTKKEADVLKLKYGLIDGKPRTLEQTGAILNITRERVRQIEAKALRKLRHPSKAMYLKEYLRCDD